MIFAFFPVNNVVESLLNSRKYEKLSTMLKFCSLGELGVIEGKTHPDFPNVVRFLGIPYAETPPRFGAAKSKLSLGEEVFKATVTSRYFCETI